MNSKSSLWFLIQHAWNERKFIFVLFLLHCMFSVVLPLSTVITTHAIVSELSLDRQVRNILIISVAYMLAFGMSGGLLTFLNYKYIPIIKNIKNVLAWRLNDKMLSIAYKDIEDPKVLNKSEQAYDAVGNFRFGAEGIYTRIFEVGGRVFTFFMYLSVQAMLGLWVWALIIPCTVFIGVLFYRSRMFDYTKREERAPEHREERYVRGTMVNPDSGKDIRIFGLSDWLKGKYGQVIGNILGIESQVKQKMMKASLVDNIVSVARDGIILALLIVNLVNGNLEIADFMVCFLALTALNAIIKTTVDDLAYIKVESKQVDDYLGFMTYPDEHSSAAQPMPDLGEPYTFEFRDVCFGYPRSEATVVENLSFTFAKGQRIALLGINGAGKTTIVKLLLRIYRPNKGTILLNGIDIHEIELTSYLKGFGVVLQDINIYATTLRENITLSDESPDEEQDCAILSSLDKVGFSDKLSTLEKVLGTQLLKLLHLDGIELSGGEKQKIAIARSLYRDSDILVLDEPSSALDTYAEYKLYSYLSESTKGKTVIFISHRLASTRFCDAILLLDQKGICEFGTHEKLMEQKGKYHNMYVTQMKYYNEHEPAEGEHA